MSRDSLVLTICLLIAVVTVIVVQTVIVTSLVSVQPSGGTASPATQSPAATTSPTAAAWQTIWGEYIKPSITPIGTILAAFIAGIFGYRNIMRQLQTTTRNAFLDMLVSNSTYRNEIERFLSAIHSKNYSVMKEGIDGQAFFYLFLMKPEIRIQIKSAIDNTEIDKVIELTQKLFTA